MGASSAREIKNSTWYAVHQPFLRWGHTVSCSVHCGPDARLGTVEMRAVPGQSPSSGGPCSYAMLRWDVRPKEGQTEVSRDEGYKL